MGALLLAKAWLWCQSQVPLCVRTGTRVSSFLFLRSCRRWPEMVIDLNSCI